MHHSMTAVELLVLASKLSKKYAELDIENLPEDYEPNGLSEEIQLKYGPQPSIEKLLKILHEHGIRAHSFGHGLYVRDSSGEKKIIPSNLKSVMTYLGY